MGVLQDGQAAIGGEGAWKRLRNSAEHAIVTGTGANGSIATAYPRRHRREKRRLTTAAEVIAAIWAALAAAAGMELAGVKEIRYNRSGDSCFWGAVCADGCTTPNGSAGSMPDLHPEPIDVACSVDVDWWLKPSA